jgi:hypothetical protein
MHYAWNSTLRYSSIDVSTYDMDSMEFLEYEEVLPENFGISPRGLENISVAPSYDRILSALGDRVRVFTPPNNTPGIKNVNCTVAWSLESPENRSTALYWRVGSDGEPYFVSGLASNSVVSPSMYTTDFTNVGSSVGLPTTSFTYAPVSSPTRRSLKTQGYFIPPNNYLKWANVRQQELPSNQTYWALNPESFVGGGDVVSVKRPGASSALYQVHCRGKGSNKIRFYASHYDSNDTPPWSNGFYYEVTASSSNKSMSLTALPNSSVIGFFDGNLYSFSNTKTYGLGLQTPDSVSPMPGYFVERMWYYPPTNLLYFCGLPQASNSIITSYSSLNIYTVNLDGSNVTQVSTVNTFYSCNNDVVFAPVDPSSGANERFAFLAGTNANFCFDSFTNTFVPTQPLIDTTYPATFTDNLLLSGVHRWDATDLNLTLTIRLTSPVTTSYSDFTNATYLGLRCQLL